MKVHYVLKGLQRSAHNLGLWRQLLSCSSCVRNHSTSRQILKELDLGQGQCQLDLLGCRSSASSSLLKQCRGPRTNCESLDVTARNYGTAATSEPKREESRERLLTPEQEHSDCHEGPEPVYERTSYSEEEFYSHDYPFHCQYGGILPRIQVAYETWGKLNKDKSNVILLQTGLSGSAHARSHEGVDSSKPGWWENFIGPCGKIDTNRFFVICSNNLGGCFGTTGPSSINPDTRKPYGGDFPIVSVADMVRVHFHLLDHLGIDKVYAVVGSSLGGMLSVLSAALFPERVKRVISISACVYANPTSVAFRYLQRIALMSDPKWKNGHYYETGLPITGMQLARKIATLTYRSGPEWEERFGRDRIEKPSSPLPRILGTEFAIEDYIRHQGETFFQKSQYDPNSLLYISKAMDLFDMREGFKTQEEGLARVRCPSLIMGASSDILFPATQQVQLAEMIRKAGNKDVTLKITESIFGHDTFLLDLKGMGTNIKEFLEQDVV